MVLSVAPPEDELLLLLEEEELLELEELEELLELDELVELEELLELDELLELEDELSAGTESVLPPQAAKTIAATGAVRRLIIICPLLVIMHVSCDAIIRSWRADVER